MTIAGILGAIVIFALLKLLIRLMKSVGKEVVSTTKKREIIDDITIKPNRTKKS